MRTLTKIMEVKSVGTFPTITVKLIATSSLLPQTILTFQQNDSSNESFFGHTAVLGGWGKGGGGDWRDDPAKVDQVVVIAVSAMYQFLGRVFSQCSKLFWPGLRCRTTVVPLQTATTPFFYSGGRWQKKRDYYHKYHKLLPMSNLCTRLC